MSPEAAPRRSRVPPVVVYLAVNVAYIVLGAYGAAGSDAPLARFLYVSILFALCSSPLLLLRAFNDRYVLLGIFMLMYFVNYGAADFLAILSGGPLSSSADYVTEAEWGICLGAVLLIGGYLFASARVRRPSDILAPNDWSTRTVLIVGLVTCVAGMVAFGYFHLVAVTINSNRATSNAFARMGAGLTFIVMLGHLVRPLGLLILAYGYARARSLTWYLLILAVLLLHLGLGFLGDTKGLPLQAIMLVVLTMVLVNNRLPRGWLLGAAVAITLAFPVFQAYRAAVVGEHGMNRAQAAQDIRKVLDLALAAKDRVNNGKERAQTIFERASTKGNVELIFQRVGVDTPFQNGRTLVELVLAFVPRIIWPDKPGVAAGQLFNKEVIRGIGDTYVSPSHLGELYWNFGWPGLIVGMTLIGMLLGFVGAKTSLAERASATRLLILLATVGTVCLQFESSVGVTYVVWIRSVAAIGLLHLLFSRRLASHPAAAESDGSHAVAGPVAELAGPVAAASLPRFPNLMS
jgi:hypothetical protein